MNTTVAYPCGTVSGRKHRGCDCLSCRRAVIDYDRHRSRMIAYGRWAPLVDAEPARRHIADLRRAGIGITQIARLSGVAGSTLSRMVYGEPHRGVGPTARIRPTTAEAILAVTAGADSHAGRSHIDATGTRYRLRALVAIGWTPARLAEQLGMNRPNLHRILENEDRAVRADTARAVTALYDRLWNTQPPQAHRNDKAAASRARNHAADRGWLPPMCLDDDRLDDPTYRPDDTRTHTNSRRKLPPADDLLWLAEQGETRTGIAHRFGVSRNTVDQALTRRQGVNR